MSNRGIKNKKYPKRGQYCEHAEDFVCGCMWGTDGVCDRPTNKKCVLAESENSSEEEVSL